MQISSESNPKIKMVKRLQQERRLRDREKLFVAEGVRWLRDVVALAIEPNMVFVSDSAEIPPALLTEVSCPIYTIPASLMRTISDVASPPGMLLVLPQPAIQIPDTPTLLLILDAVQTPGNMGTMLRTAAAAGADGVLLAPGCVDLFNSKVVRGAMGAQLRLATEACSWDAIASKTAAMQVLIASAESTLSYTEWNWSQPTALIVGNEANGPCPIARSLGQGVRIPMAAETESLNAAMAAGVLLFEAARQRRGPT